MPGKNGINIYIYWNKSGKYDILFSGSKIDAGGILVRFGFEGK
jgi:hypothetical protein